MRWQGIDSQRMLNAMMLGTEMAIHRHPKSNETVPARGQVRDSNSVVDDAAPKKW